jgi:hypothetical protein
MDLKMKQPTKIIGFSLLSLILILNFQTTWAGQTGKITGKVIDTQTGAPLPGTNVVIEGTTMGAAADLEGDFIILNIPPGTYNLFASMIGYQKMRFSSVKVSVDRTTRVDFRLESTVLELGESVTIVAEQPMIQKDLTATSYSVSSDEIKAMPVESFQEILQLQAGIVEDSQGELHIRGGRSSEIAYMIDGVSVSDPYSGKMAVNVDQGAIQELKVISGTFNAEYGQVMSGIVEIVTKDPENQLKTGGSFYFGDYLSSRKKLFYNIDDLNPTAIYNAQFYLTGPMPILSNKLSFYFSLRRLYNDGWLYGERRYNPADSSNFETTDAIYIKQTGDNESVPMNDNSQYYTNAKIVFSITPEMKLSYSFLGDLSQNRYYNHLYKYNPDGAVTNHQYGYTHILNLNCMISPKAFYTVKLSRYYLNFKSYLYEDQNDERYVNPVILRNREDDFAFLTGGTNMSYFYRTTTVNIAKFDLTSQVTKVHQIKTGIEYKYNQIHAHHRSAYFNGIEGGGIFSAEDFFNRGKYTHNPVEFAAYFQDKVELNNMTLNVGLRYDYFYSKGSVPKDLRDPGNNLELADAYSNAKKKHQLSPRIGIAFPISASGVFHTSYGHFFQIPPYEFLYMNSRFAVASGGVNTLMGNADLSPQSTVIYEVGFQQELLGLIGIDVTGFYKDARNLLGTRIYSTYRSGYDYARYENRDYGNIRGITLAVNKRPSSSDHLTVSFDYTFQITEGNASDPRHEYYNNQSFPPKKSNIQVIPLDWDQRHTVNLSISYYNPRIIGIGLIGQFQSGLPYTPAIQTRETTFENSGRKPFNYNVDLRISRQFSFWKMKYNFFVKVYNLFDRKNEIDVYGDTGRAGYSLVSQYIADRRGYVNSLEEWLNRPDFYSEPRKVLVGFDLDF